MFTSRAKMGRPVVHLDRLAETLEISHRFPRARLLRQASGSISPWVCCTHRASPPSRCTRAARPSAPTVRWPQPLRPAPTHSPRTGTGSPAPRIARRPLPHPKRCPPAPPHGARPDTPSSVRTAPCRPLSIPANYANRGAPPRRAGPGLRRESRRPPPNRAVSSPTPWTMGKLSAQWSKKV